MADPRAGIEFIDFDNGDTLQLTGHAKILWNERSLPGAHKPGHSLAPFIRRCSQ